MTATVLKFPSRKGLVWIEPTDDEGGAWAVYHQRTGRAPQKVIWHLAYDLAEIDARAIAKQTGAELLDIEIEPKGAA